MPLEPIRLAHYMPTMIVLPEFTFDEPCLKCGGNRRYVGGGGCVQFNSVPSVLRHTHDRDSNRRCKARLGSVPSAIERSTLTGDYDGLESWSGSGHT
jgi:hypothetical protein